MRTIRPPGSALLLAIASSVALVLACGGSGTETATGPSTKVVQKVIPAPKVFGIDDLVAVGLKKSRQYDIAGLTGATDAWLGFYGPNPAERKDYELRFYPSHEAAARDGTALADEGVGDGMRARKDSQTWPEGQRERWFAGGVTDVSSPGSRQAPGPKYWDYVIYGNVIMLCQGADSTQSLETCSALVQALGGPDLLK